MGKLALNFICKDETPVIENMLESAKGIVDLIVVNDTGSTDGTQQIIKNFGEKYGIPTYVFERPFDDFENSRNHAMQKLRDVVKELNWNADQVHGFWFPDYDTHFPRMLDKSLKNDGVLRYQWRARELAITESSPRRICIDIGANVGLWSCELVEHFDQVIAFEPVEEFRKCFERNVKKSNYIMHPCALGREESFINMNIVEGNTGHSHIDTSSIGRGTIPLKTLDSFNFDKQIELKPKSVAVFRSKNPINGLIYGHGGIKLFSKDCFSTERLDRPDMTTTLADSYIKLNILATEHRFNYTPYATWRTAFREAVKLSAGINKNNNDQESQERLTMWTEAGLETQYGYFAIQGARQGIAYAKSKNADFTLVNDFAWLEDKFKEWCGINE